MEKCAENQKVLYQSIEYYVEKNEEIPHTLYKRWTCPAHQDRGYELFIENLGKPDAVIIDEKKNAHPTTWMYRLKGLTPRVQTMGDGMIHYFKDDKIMTMNGWKKKVKGG